MKSVHRNFISVALFLSLILCACTKKIAPDNPPTPPPAPDVPASATSLTLKTENRSISYGTPMVFTAAINPTTKANNTSSLGTVTFQLDDKIVCNDVQVVEKPENVMTAECQMPIDASIGFHKVSAHYSGVEKIYLPSNGSDTYTINQAKTTLDVIIDDMNPPYGSAARFTAAVSVVDSNSRLKPEGSVAFSISGTKIQGCSNVPVIETQAVCSINPLPTDAGSYAVLAVFTPHDDNYSGSNASIPNYSITPLTPRVDIVATTNPQYAQSVLITATVSHSKYSDKITGNIKFILDGNVINECESVSLNKQKANCPFDILVDPTIAHTIAAQYISTNKNFNGAQNTLNGYTMRKITPKIDINVNPSKATYGQNIEITAKLDKIFDKGVTPSGTVAFNVNGTIIQGCDSVLVNNGQATCTAYKIKDLSTTITVQYKSSDHYYNSTDQTTTIFAESCNAKEVTIDYSSCTADAGCKLTFACNNPAVMTSFFNAPNKLKKSRTLKNENESELVFTIDSRQPDNYVKSIDPKFPAILEKISNVNKKNIPSNWYIYKKTENDPQTTLELKCQPTANFDIECVGFAPVGAQLAMSGTLIDNRQYSQMKVVLNKITINPLKTLSSTSSTKCGQFGTTYQRIFDCSQRVKNYAGFGTGKSDNGFTPFALGNSDPDSNNDPDKNWFLVSCPNDQSNPNNDCFWLSPTMTTKNPWNASDTMENPSLKDGEYDSLNNPMKQYIGKRLLWSGLFVGEQGKSSYNFFAANGKDPYKDAPTAEPHYDLYPIIQLQDPAVRTADGIYTPISSKQPKISSDFKNVYNNVSYLQSVCQSKEKTNLLSDVVYKWQMPSYPMALTLTGGGSCQQSNCLCEQPNRQAPALCHPYGFRAVSALPGFAQNSFMLSSVGNIPESKEDLFYKPFVFSADDGTNGTGGMISPGINDITFANELPVRCVSTQW